MRQATRIPVASLGIFGVIGRIVATRINAPRKGGLQGYVPRSDQPLPWVVTSFFPLIWGQLAIGFLF